MPVLTPARLAFAAAMKAACRELSGAALCAAAAKAHAEYRAATARAS